MSFDIRQPDEEFRLSQDLLFRKAKCTDFFIQNNSFNLPAGDDHFLIKINDWNDNVHLFPSSIGNTESTQYFVSIPYSVGVPVSYHPVDMTRPDYESKSMLKAERHIRVTLRKGDGTLIDASEFGAGTSCHMIIHFE